MGDEIGMGVNRKGTRLLCIAHGETERSASAMASSVDEVRRFFVQEWFGSEDDEYLTEVMSELAKHDWDDGSLDWQFEIGSVSVQDVVDVGNAPKTSADFAKEPIVLTDEQAAALERMVEPVPSAQAIAEQWYNETQIAMSVAGNFREEPHRRIPPDISSQEFAQWLTHEYRLAMAKGIELERQRCWEPRYTIDQIVDGVTLEWVVVVPNWIKARAQFCEYGVWRSGDSIYCGEETEGADSVLASSVDDGKQKMLDLHKSRFRAEIERAVGK